MNVAILTVSDRSARGERRDESGPLIAEWVRGQGAAVVQAELVPDVLEAISERLAAWADSGTCDVILTTGGTGFAPRDVTPEATRAVVDRLAPGIAEALRAESLKLTPHAMLSRAVAGIRKSTLVVNLPGSPKAVREHLAILAPVLSHAVALLRQSPEAEAGHRG